MKRSYTIEFRDHADFDTDKVMNIETNENGSVTFQVNGQSFTLGPHAGQELQTVLRECFGAHEVDS